MVDFSITVGDLASIVVVLGAVIGFGIWVNRRLNRHERDHAATTALLSLLVKEASDRSPRFKAEIAGFDALLRAWEGQHVVQGNPITGAEAARRQFLSTQLQAGQTLSHADLTELNQILEKELADARQSNADLAVIIALIILIGLVIAALALASRSS